MSTLQRNGGTAGIVAGVMGLVLFILYLSLGQTPEDPAAAIEQIKAKTTAWQLAGIGGVLAIGFSLVFVAALFAHLRDRAPTRSHAFLYVTVVGLAFYGLGSLLQWVAGPQLARTTDAVAATHAYVAVSAVGNTLNVGGAAFVGAGVLLWGWAIVGTRALSALAGWLGIVAGAISIIGAFYPTQAVILFLNFIAGIVWLAWVGLELRRPAPTMAAART